MANDVFAAALHEFNHQAGMMLAQHRRWRKALARIRAAGDPVPVAVQNEDGSLSIHAGHREVDTAADEREGDALEEMWPATVAALDALKAATRGEGERRVTGEAARLCRLLGGDHRAIMSKDSWSDDDDAQACGFMRAIDDALPAAAHLPRPMPTITVAATVPGLDALARQMAEMGQSVLAAGAQVVAAAGAVASAEASKPAVVTSSPTGDKEAQALAVLMKHPEWSNKQISDAVGVHEKTLYRWEKFRRARGHLETGRERYAQRDDTE
jgi:hypothetical protein